MITRPRGFAKFCLARLVRCAEDRTSNEFASTSPHRRPGGSSRDGRAACAADRGLPLAPPTLLRTLAPETRAADAHIAELDRKLRGRLCLFAKRLERGRVYLAASRGRRGDADAGAAVDAAGRDRLASTNPHRPAGTRRMSCGNVNRPPFQPRQRSLVVIRRADVDSVTGGFKFL